jgi:hypothetical protein
MQDAGLCRRFYENIKVNPNFNGFCADTGNQQCRGDYADS